MPNGIPISITSIKVSNYYELWLLFYVLPLSFDDLYEGSLESNSLMS